MAVGSAGIAPAFAGRPADAGRTLVGSEGFEPPTLAM